MAKRLLNVQKIVNLSSDPATGTAGEIYFNTSISKYKYHNGTSWVEFSGGGISEISEDLTPELGGNLSASGFGINDIDYINFDNTTTTAPTEGTLVWNSGEGTLALGLLGGNIDLDIGQENVVLCYNGTASAMSKGQVVYINGAQGQKPSIALASSATEGSSSKTLGIVAEAINPGGDGFVTTFGAIKGVNTEIFTEGAALWLSTTPGQLTQTPPQSPNHLVFVGYCLNSSSSAGRIFIEPQNGYEIDELHDVLITSKLDNDILTYNSSASVWVNQNLATAITEVDGTGSGIDSDLLDGQHGSYYAPISGKLSQFAATTSAELAGVISDETGSGLLVFSTSPSLTTPNIGAASGTSLSLTGALIAASKSFDIPHPTKEDMRLRYGSLEGPEAGVYIRGRSNSSIIALPDYWTGLVDEDSITVQITSIGKHRNLYVKDVSNNTVTIGGCRGDFEFFYFIQAERKDIDKLVVEYDSKLQS